MFDPFEIDLPVKEIIPAVRQHLKESNTLIVHAPPGAGKSTLIPLAVFQEAWLAGKKVIMLEPRRLAAKTIALRMASLLGESLGETVGYRIRFESQIGPSTKIEVVTEGILTRMLHSDPTLKDTALVIFDEFHERSIHADVALALARQAQVVSRKDLRIMVMSATLNMPELKELLRAPVAESLGRLFPVEVIHAGKVEESMLPEMISSVVEKAVKERAGDVLVFLPGEADIRQCEKILKSKLRDFSLHPLYGKLPASQQFLAIMPNRNGKRKIVLATSIAQTSLTIEGIGIVVDSGFEKTSRFDARSGLSRLETQRIALDTANQRTGRAGRLGPGTCYRLWTAAEESSMAKYSVPEILQADLCNLVLDMAEWGITNIAEMTWLTPPPPEALAGATETLHDLQALEHGRITTHGKKIHALPCHPRIAHMMLVAQEKNKLGLATDIAAFLEERDPLPRDAGIDINLRIEALRRFRREHGVAKPMKKVEKVAASYRRLFQIDAENEEVESYETGVLLAYAYPERIAFARPGNNAQFQMANGKYASASHKDDLAHEPWLSVSHVDARQGMGKIFMASPLNPKDLLPMVKEIQKIDWDPETGELIAKMEVRIGSIVLRTKSLPATDERLRPKAISEFLKKEGEELLPFTEDVKAFQKKILQLRKEFPEEGWPDLSTSTLLMTNSEWLLPHLSEVETEEDLQELDLLKILEKRLNKEQLTRFQALLTKNSPAF